MAALQLMEQRGSGLARMKAAMLDHGLDAPQLDGFTAFGPNMLTICASFSLGTIPPQSRLMWISAARAARSPHIFRTCSTPPA